MMKIMLAVMVVSLVANIFLWRMFRKAHRKNALFSRELGMRRDDFQKLREVEKRNSLLFKETIALRSLVGVAHYKR